MSEDQPDEQPTSTWRGGLIYVAAYLWALAAWPPYRLIHWMKHRRAKAPVAQIEGDAVTVPMTSLIDLAVDAWRLECWLIKLDGGHSTAPGRFVARQLNAFLHRFELETVDLTGQRYEPGLAVELLGNVQDETVPPDVVIVDEMVTPLCLWRGKVVRLGQLVTRSSAASRSSGESS
jgi:hypothetical protein